MRVEQFFKRRIVWTLTMLAVCGLNSRPLVADDTPEASASQPIVLEPTDEADPAVVQLDDRASSEDSDAPLIGDFELIDQDGNPFSSDELKGHHWVASFIFTSCMGYCPNLVKNLRLDIVDRVDDPDVRFVTISVDPERDTPERLKQFAEVFGADPDRWTFLTGEKETIYQLVQHGFRQVVAEETGPDVPPGFEVAHSLNLIHVGPDGQVLGTYDSREADEVVVLRKVLNGEIETPEEHRPPEVRPRESADNEVEPLAEPVHAAAEAPARADQLPAWAQRLPRTNALLNGLATVLLLFGFVTIKSGRVSVHKRLMLMAFATSVAFLACYLTYHFALHHYTGTHGKSFEGTGPVRSVYFAILVSHVLLAAAVPVLAIVTIVRGLNEQWLAHRRIARVTFPIWLYVSVTGVIIYGMLYHWPN